MTRASGALPPTLKVSRRTSKYGMWSRVAPMVRAKLLKATELKGKSEADSVPAMPVPWKSRASPLPSIPGRKASTP